MKCFSCDLDQVLFEHQSLENRQQVHIGVAQIVTIHRYRSIVFSIRHPSLDFTES
jgi:hypothetical protein